MNYLKAMLGQSRNDVVFVGYQAEGTPGRDILRFVDGIRPAPEEIRLVHGDQGARDALAEALQERGHRVVIP